MKVIFFLLLLFFLPIRNEAQVLHPMENNETYERRMEWFGQAKLGIMIHWGIYAVRGVSESWSFHNEQIPYKEYYDQMKGFTASKYDPEFWASLIKESGAQYTVITTKHHDGFALWDTKVGKLSAKKCSPAKRDLITPFADAIRKEGIHLGLYYSLIDWSRDDYPNKTKSITRYDVKKDPGKWVHFCKFNFAQLKEINMLYHPDLIWFDGGWEQTAEQWHSKEIATLLRSTNPDVILNSRLPGYGDYETPELGIPVTKPKSKYWELCYTINDSWGWQPQDTNFKSPPVILNTFIDCLSMGGNLLLDIGPKADGTIPEQEIKILRYLGNWINRNKEAVYNTRAGLPYESYHGYSTLNQKGNVIYVYLPSIPTEPLELKGIKNDIEHINIVGSGKSLTYKVYNKISWSKVPGVLYVDVPVADCSDDVTVIAIHLNGPVGLYLGSGQNN